MLRPRSTRALLRVTTAISVLLGSTFSALAQQADEGFLGVVVLGESKREVVTDTAVSKTEIDETEIKDRQAGTIAQLIDSVPGVALINGATASGSAINIRGFGANSTFGTDQKVLIKIDGATKGGEELYRIGTQLFTDPFLYKNVEVLRGTIGSFEYGSGVFGGVVLLETIDASSLTEGNTGFAGRQTFEFTSNGGGLASSTTLAYQASDDAEFLFNYTRRTLGTRKDGNGDDISPETGSIDDPSWLAKAKFFFGEAKDHSLTLSFTDTVQEARDVPYETFGTFDFGNVDRVVHHRTASVLYNWNPVDNDLINLGVDLVYSNEQIDSTALPGGSPFTVGLRDADHRYETTTFRVKNSALFSTGRVNHDLRTGLEITSRKRLDASSAPGGVKEVFALYAVDDMQIGDRLTVTPALRYETQTIYPDPTIAPGKFSQDGLMGGLAMRYAFDNGWSVFGSAAYTENLPILDDLGSAVLIDQSERGEIFEFGVAFDRGDVFASGDQLAARLGYYKQSLDNLTTYEARGNFADGIDRIDREGLELEVSYAMETGLYLDLNAHVSNGTSATRGGVRADWTQNPADTLRLTVGKKFSEMLDLSWEVEAAKRFTSGTTDVPGFGVHNLRATYVPQRGALEGTEIRFGVENVFDRYYTPRLSQRAATGRNFKVTISKTF